MNPRAVIRMRHSTKLLWVFTKSQYLQICRTFAQKGSCPYGIRCRFIHLALPLPVDEVGVLSFMPNYATPAASPLNHACSIDSCLKDWGNDMFGFDCARGLRTSPGAWNLDLRQERSALYQSNGSMYQPPLVRRSYTLVNHSTAGICFHYFLNGKKTCKG